MADIHLRRLRLDEERKRRKKEEGRRNHRAII